MKATARAADDSERTPRLVSTVVDADRTSGKAGGGATCAPGYRPRAEAMHSSGWLMLADDSANGDDQTPAHIPCCALMFGAYRFAGCPRWRVNGSRNSTPSYRRSPRHRHPLARSSVLAIHGKVVYQEQLAHRYIDPVHPSKAALPADRRFIEVASIEADHYPRCDAPVEAEAAAR